MIITNKFIYIHFPKTGGTFVTRILKKLEDDGVHPRDSRFFRKNKSKHKFEIFEYNDFYPSRFKRNFQHNFCSHIPNKYRYLPIVSNKRNPLDIYVSLYESRDWILNINEKETRFVQHHFPKYPDLEFEEFLYFCDIVLNKKILRKLINVKIIAELGFLSILFLLTFYQNSKNILTENSGRISVNSIKSNLFDVIFLEQSTLRSDLRRILIKSGYPKKELEFIQSFVKINVSETRRMQNFKQYYDESLYNFALEKEYFLFEFFPEYN